MSSKCKITVLRRSLDKELIAEYLDDEHSGMSLCESFVDGQEFIVDPPYVMPEGFCESAWSTVEGVLARVASGEDMPGMRFPGVRIASCPDWFRPVIFKIERME